MSIYNFWIRTCIEVEVLRGDLLIKYAKTGVPVTGILSEKDLNAVPQKFSLQGRALTEPVVGFFAGVSRRKYTWVI